MIGVFKLQMEVSMSNIHKNKRPTINLGTAAEITLPSGKLYYTETSSIVARGAKLLSWKIEVVSYIGECECSTINSLAHRGVSIDVNRRNVQEYLERLATKDEFELVYSEQLARLPG